MREVRQSPGVERAAEVVLRGRFVMAYLEGDCPTFPAEDAKFLDWAGVRRREVVSMGPSPVDAAISDLGETLNLFCLATTDWRGVHQITGFKMAMELHGSIWQEECPTCGACRCVNVDQCDDRVRCSRCDRLLLPRIVRPGEPMIESQFQCAMEAAGRCDVFVNAATTDSMGHAAVLLCEAKANGATVIQIADDHDPAGMADIVMHGPPESVIPDLARQVAAASPQKGEQ